VDNVDAQFYQVLRENGVSVLDFTPVFLAHRVEAGGPLFCKTDTHWSEQGCLLTAQLIADEIKARPWLANVPKRNYETTTSAADISGDLAGMLGEAGTKEKLTFTTVQERTANGLLPVDSWRDSPIVLLGDSHNLILHGGDDMLFAGAGLLDHLALRLGFPADLVAVRGSGATPARKNLAQRKDSFLAQEGGGRSPDGEFL